MFKLAKHYYNAFLNSFAGLRFIIKEKAFQTELAIILLIIPVLIAINKTPLEKAFLFFTTSCILIVEIINTAIEKTVDRISLQQNRVSKIIKDLGSLAVLSSIVLCIVTWWLLVFC